MACGRKLSIGDRRGDNPEVAGKMVRAFSADLSLPPSISLSHVFRRSILDSPAAAAAAAALAGGG